jgi:hypothetical protein
MVPFPFLCLLAGLWDTTTSMMNKSIVAYSSLDELKAAELREWQAMPAHERLRAVSELTAAAWRMKEPARDVRRIQRTLVHLQRAGS